MKATLHKDLIIKLYFYLLQAERSFHKVLGNSWADLKDFYSPSRVQALKDLLEILNRILGRADNHHVRLDRDALSRHYPAVGIFQYLFGKKIAAWKKEWHFRTTEIEYMVYCLRSALDMLQATAMPPRDALIALRLDLCQCRSILENRCHGLPVFQLGWRIEHLYVFAWLHPLTLTDVLPGQAAALAPARQSA